MEYFDWKMIFGLVTFAITITTVAYALGKLHQYLKDHIKDKKIHNDLEELRVEFMPAKEVEIQLIFIKEKVGEIKNNQEKIISLINGQKK